MKKFTQLLEDTYTSEYKIKKVLGPDGKWHDHKLRPHRIDFKNSKMHGEPAQKDSGQDVGMKEEIMTIDEQINEVLSKDATAGDWIHDFVHSDNPKFEGKSKEKRKQMALAAYYAKQQNEEIELEEGDLSVRHLYNKFADAHVGGGNTKPTEKAIKKVHGDEVLKHMKKAANANAKGDMDKEENHFDNAQNAARKTDRIGGTVGRGRSEFMRKRREWSEEVEIDENAPVAPVPDRKYIIGTPEHKAYKATKKPINGHPTNGKEGTMKSFKEMLETINELSPKTLGSYIKKAKGEAIGAANAMGMTRQSTNVHQSAEKKMIKRAGGINKAVDRLTNEEVDQIEEKSDQAKQNKTMKNMMDASRGARYKVQNKVSADDVRNWDGKHPTPRAQNVAIGRALRNEDKKEDPPFDGPYTKSPGTVKDKSGAVHTPMSRAKHLARQAMQQKMKEDIDLFFEAKDEGEYGYEGDMAISQLKTICRHSEEFMGMLKPDTDLPEWVQSKITLATDYIQTAHDYMSSEMNEELKGDQHKLDKNKNGKIDSGDLKMVRGEECPECHKAPCECGHMKEDTYAGLEALKKMGLPTAARSSHPRGVNIDTVEGWDHPHDAVKKKEVKEESEVETRTLSFSDFMSQLNEYTPGPGGVTRVQGRSYGAQYRDPEGEDDADEKKKQVAKSEPAVKRGRGRPAGSKSGANQKVTTGRKGSGVDYTGYKLHLPNSNR